MLMIRLLCHYTIKHWKNCSEKLRLNEEIINKCYTTGFRYKDLEKFVKYVCQAYKGDHKPETHPPATPVIDFYKLALQLPPSAAWHFNCLLQLAALV
ncbi:hypothetical protein PVK06_036792 [Gossypium arboreum]|uniref:Uncharacterized protein n=1 Tax=Gossypium arboreum TaxID=29729 RepID=A0ABR0NL21_GOSAR|nr:hypothetical protein PVK06_036792 [Gossypium arboreum]